MQKLRIVTHDTIFHADDVFAVAMLSRLYPYPDCHVVRTRDPEKLRIAIEDPDTIVIDVGGVYDPGRLNFDHHQDMNLMSAAGLVYQYFKDQICPVEAQPYFEEFISAIDMIDTNRGNIYATWNTLPVGFRNVSSIIGGFNRDVRDHIQQDFCFFFAVDFAKSILANEIYGAEKKAESEAAYGNRVILPNNVAVFEQHSATWKEKKDHVFAVMPHANGWQIQSRDTSIAVVPESVAELPGFIFRHMSGFMATVKDRDIAVAFAAGLPEYRTEG